MFQTPQTCFWKYRWKSPIAIQLFYSTSNKVIATVSGIGNIMYTRVMRWLKKKKKGGGGGAVHLLYCRIGELSESVQLIFHIK